MRHVKGNDLDLHPACMVLCPWMWSWIWHYVVRVIDFDVTEMITTLTIRRWSVFPKVCSTGDDMPVLIQSKHREDNGLGGDNDHGVKV